MMTELLARVYVRYVNLYDGSRNGAYGIVQRHRGVRVGASIEYDAVGIESRFLYLVNKEAFYVALVIVYLHCGVTPAQ